MTDDAQTTFEEVVRRKLSQKTTIPWSKEAIEEIIDNFDQQLEDLVEHTDRDFLEDQWIRDSRGKPPREAIDDRDVRRATDDIYHSICSCSGEADWSQDIMDEELDDFEVDEVHEKAESAEDEGSRSDGYESEQGGSESDTDSE